MSIWDFIGERILCTGETRVRRSLWELVQPMGLGNRDTFQFPFLHSFLFISRSPLIVIMQCLTHTKLPLNALYKRTLICVHVDCLAKPECIEQFKNGLIKNAKCSLKEKGVVRFDIIQEKEHRNHFKLIETYYDAEALKSHRSSAHFKEFDELTKTALLEPRTKVEYETVYPDNVSGWIKH